MVMVIYTALPSPVPPIYLCPPIYLTPAPTTSQPAIIDGGRAEPDAALSMREKAEGTRDDVKAEGEG